ncbi:hypothetical protein [Nitrosomonas communis]|uniref:Uncharacterized protein n=1 Tax=Nitrosomonas communis TaxID=44574 RepID=A0A1I4VQ90_9PROT|nr:hypothetical protein [Nitrosomonas communis]SFN03237.1 hypothetical protein SAMN05421863_10883 [Nitrosomonas communis]
MLVLNDPNLVSRPLNPAVRKLMQQRFTEVCSEELYNYDRHGYAIMVEPGDSVAAIEQEIDFSILRNSFDGTRYRGPDLTPPFEALEEHLKYRDIGGEVFPLTHFPQLSTDIHYHTKMSFV